MALTTKVVGSNNLYLSPMHINERTIVGYEVDDDHPSMRRKSKKQKAEVRKKALKESKGRVAAYILQAMKRIKDNGCIMAPYHYG